MRVFEDDDTGEIIIDDIRIEGFIIDDKCKKCDNHLIYYEKYDASFCAYCNEWKEEKCGDVNCVYCKNRPDKPL